MAQPDNNGGSPNSQLGFEAELFKAADKLRGNMEPSDYKNVALGLIFLKYISDPFEACHAELLPEDYAGLALNKLMLGELRIADVERFIEERTA